MSDRCKRKYIAPIFPNGGKENLEEIQTSQSNIPSWKDSRPAHKEIDQKAS